jgi:hypothetical protein
MQLRVLSTMAEVSAERNSTLIFPLPVELMRLVDTLAGNSLAGNGSGSSRGAADTDQPAAVGSPAPRDAA